MFPHHNIHKNAWNSLDGKKHNQIQNVLIEKRPHSNIADVRSFRGTLCDTDYYPAVVKVREREGETVSM
jgi:hypothetical protein